MTVWRGSSFFLSNVIPPTGSWSLTTNGSRSSVGRVE
jgi:hypothetical protein